MQSKGCAPFALNQEKAMAVYVPLPGSDRTLLPNSRPAGRPNPSELASITVRVRSAVQDASEALEKWVYEQADKSLADRTWLTHEELAAKQGASKEDLDKVEAFAQQHGLFIVHRDAAERSIELQGKLGDLLAAFPADVQMYHHANGTYRGRRGEIGVPQGLDQIVTGVFGFDTRPKHRHDAFRSAGKGVAPESGPGGSNGVNPADFAKRYAFPAKQGNTALDGSGQTIAIIELGGGFRASDLRVYFNELGVPLPAVASVSVDHGKNGPTNADSADGEVMLDLEVAGAVAPKAKFAVYFAPNTDKGFIDAINAAVHDKERKPSVISISWGGSESVADQQSIRAYHEVFTSAAALGITVCVASGDHGTANETEQYFDGKIHVGHPACDDLVLGCGGTQIDNGKDVAWNDGTGLANNGGWATGGGISVVFPVPSYQAGHTQPVSLDTKKAGRAVPDISMSATNYFNRVDGVEYAGGGTSAVAPLMSALIALLNQAKQKRAGFINPMLYKTVAKGTTHPIASGNNAIHGATAGYPAGPGCTGLGTPDGTAILNNL
jgi:kumamolisin